jgi:filamin
VAPSSTLALPEFGAVFKRAGTYLVRATAGRFNIDGWPKLLQVLPGPVAPPRCSIRGGATADKAARPLQDVVADAPVKIMLRTADDFGNLRSEGGDRVQCTLDSVRGHSAPVEVVDLGDGTYSIGFTVTAVGRWILHVLVNGTPVKDKGWEFNVADGPMAPDALQLVLDPAEARSGVFSCGAVSAVFAQVVDPERMMTGKEAVSLRMTSPSGVSTMLPLTLAESRGFYSSQCPWSEVGEFVVEITLDGLQIVNSPLAVQVMPQLVHLPTCTIEWASSNRGRAGIPLKFAVQAYDARGNRIERGGETIWYEVLHEDRVINPKVPAVDQGLGRYEGVVCLEEVSAVPYQVQLSMDGEIPVKQCPVSCSPADTHFPQCVVDVRETLQITAGAWSSFYILRNDRFGNPVTIGDEGEHHAPPLDGRTTKSKALLSSSNTYAPPFYVDVGDTPVAVDLVEQVGGRCEVRLMSPRAGSYTLHVYGETPVVPGARPPQGSDKLQVGLPLHPCPSPPSILNSLRVRICALKAERAGV